MQEFPADPMSSEEYRAAFYTIQLRAEIERQRKQDKQTILVLLPLVAVLAVPLIVKVILEATT